MTADRELFHYLLDQRDVIRREVKQLDNGIESLTESDDPEVAKAIQQHVASMKQRVEEGRPIRMRDPLFAAIFQHADKIKLETEPTEHGARVVETSTDPYVVQLIQTHADVVSRFLKYGYEEAEANHPVPSE